MSEVEAKVNELEKKVELLARALSMMMVEGEDCYLDANYFTVLVEISFRKTLMPFTTAGINLDAFIPSSLPLRPKVTKLMK